MSWDKVGAKCVCIFDGVRGTDKGVLISPPPPMGTIVVISGMRPGVWNDGKALLIREYPNYDENLGFDIGWHISRFRPLVTKTESEDVQMFKHIVDNAPCLEHTE